MDPILYTYADIIIHIGILGNGVEIFLDKMSDVIIIIHY